jgi:capsular polysaccharide biosynthesis protein
VKDPDSAASVSADDDLRDRLWAYEDFSAAQEHPSIDVTGAFASLGFLRAALRRTRRFWMGMGALGFLIGCGIYVSSPPAYSAATTLLLTNAPGTDPGTAMLTEQSLAASLPVAAAAVRQLGLTESPGTLLADCTVTPVTDQVLQISVSAPSGTQALRGTQAIAAQFLKFRATLLTTQEKQQTASLNAAVAQAQHDLSALGSKITGLGAAIPSSAAASPPSSRLGRLEAQYTDADNRLITLKQQVAGTIAQDQVSVTSQVNGSQVLNPATLGKHSKFKYVAYDIVAAVFAGLIVGMAIVVVRELVSDRLRRRDDISLALGIPVKLSVGAVNGGRFSVSSRARAARKSNLRKVAMYLRLAVPRQVGQVPRTLAVLPVDNAEQIAPAVSQLARSCVKDGMRIAVADLVKGAPVARSLGVRKTGRTPAVVDGASVLVVVPEPDDAVLLGPLRPAGPPSLTPPPDRDLLIAISAVDLLITYLELEPAQGSEHLATWATDGVAVVTAGLTHGQKAYSVGEMLRTSGVRVGSAVLVNTDKGDDSLGTEPALPEFVAGSA